MFFKRKENARRRLPRWIPAWLDTPLRLLLKLAIAVSFLFFCVACFYWYQAGKFDIEKVAEMPARTLILDKNGNEYATLYGQRRRLVSYAEIPPHLLHALYAREDEDFETHWGVKLKGLVRATLRNIKDGKFTQGGSTLSMQLVKNTYDNREKTIHRKLLEIALTYRLENHYEKEDIVTHYLNRIYFGSGCYGVEEAALSYFGKSVKDLHEGESALLAGIIRGPHIYSPKRNLDGAITQRDQVLDRMVKIGRITEQEKKRIQAFPIKLAETKSTQKTNSYTLQTIKRHLKVIFEVEELEKEGLTIYTTIDPEMIKKLDQAHTHYKHNGENPLQTAGVVIDSKSGAIRAINGGYDIQKSPHNIALDSRRDLRGSYFPLLELAALEYGHNPIKNEALQSGRQLGFDKLIQFSKKLGLNGEFKKTEDLYRGFTDATPLRVATAYTVFTNDGEIPHTYIIKNIKNQAGESIYENPSKKKAVATKGNTKEVFKLYKKTPGKLLQFISLDATMRDGWAVSVDDINTIVLWCGHDQSTKIQTDRRQLQQSLQKVLKSLSSGDPHPQ